MNMIKYLPILFLIACSSPEKEYTIVTTSPHEMTINKSMVGKVDNNIYFFDTLAPGENSWIKLDTFCNDDAATLGGIRLNFPYIACENNCYGDVGNSLVLNQHRPCR